MNVLCIGDVVGKAGRHALIEGLALMKAEQHIDVVIVNAENVAGGSGITPRIATFLLRSGCDVITLGDHVWDRPEIIDYLNETPRMIRPANFPDGTPGKGWVIVPTPGGGKIGVINLLGRVFIRYNTDCPFRALERIVEEIRRETPNIIVDMHAETTSEKVALGWFIDGKVSGVVGTHTHVQTADDKVLPRGTAYITDLGMTGPYDSVIGQNKHKIIERFLTSMPVRFEVAKDDPWLHGVLIDIDEQTGRARNITRIQRRIPWETGKD